MLITEDDLVESWLFGNESDFDHVITAFNNLHWKHFLHRLNWMSQHFVFFSLIDDFKDGLGIIGSVEAKLNVVFSGLEHNRND